MVCERVIVIGEVCLNPLHDISHGGGAKVTYTMLDSSLRLSVNLFWMTVGWGRHPMIASAS